MNEDHLFKTIFKAINVACLVLKPEEEDYLFVEANEAYLKITGTSPEDLLGRPCADIFPQDPNLGTYEADPLIASLRKVVSEKRTDQMKQLRFDIPVRGTTEIMEKYWNIENAPVLNASGQVAYILHMVEDVTSQVLLKKQEERLQKETEIHKQQVSHFIAANPNGLYSMDREGNFLNSNQGLADIAEVPLEELLKMNFLPFCSEEDRDHILDHFQRAIAGETTKFEAKFISAKGREIILEISLAPMESNGRITGAYGIAIDLTSLRQSEKIVVTKKNYLQANAAFINSLLQQELTAENLQEPLALIGEAMNVDRILYFLAHPCPENRRSMMSLNMEWNNGKADSQRNSPELQNIPKADLDRFIGGLGRKRLFSANIHELSEGEVKQMAQSMDVRALLMLPIFLKNKMQGIIVLHDCTRERQWNEEEISFLKTLAANLTASFEKRAAKAALKEQQEALRLSEQKFKALVQEGSDLTAILDTEGTYKFVSESSTKALGTPPEGYIGRNAFEFIHPEDHAYITEQFSSLENLIQFKLAPYRFMNSKGEWRWLETTLTNLTEDPAVQGIVGNSRDITRILTQEGEIRQLNERYRLAATATQDLMYDWDMETDEVTRFYKGFSHFLGYPVSTVKQRHFWGEHIHPDELKDLKKQQEAALQDSGQDHIIAEYRFRRADGSYAHIIDRAYIIRNSGGKPVRMVGATSDISELKSKEEALKIANRRFHLAMKATNEMIWDWDMNTGNIKCGKVFTEIFGKEVSKESRPSDLWYTKIHPEDRERVELSVAAAINDPEVSKWREEYRMIKLNGELAYVDDRAYIERDASGKAIRMVGSTLDSTESRMAMTRIEQQNELLREVAWDQSHLVRAPLTRMKMLLDLLEPGEEGIMASEAILRHLNASYEELDQIVRNIVRKSEKVKETEAVEV